MAWIVRGKRYDLSNFKHPGGPIAIGLAKGREADELIRSYHPFAEEKVRKILEKYEVKDAPQEPPEKIYDQEDSPFAKEVKEMAAEYFKTHPRTADTRRCIEYVIMAALCLISAYFFVKGYWFSLLTTPTLFWLFGVNTFHDASHFAISRIWWVNAIFTYLYPYFSSPLAWYYQHVVGHHLYPNIKGKDPDLNNASPLHRYMSWHRFRPLHRFQALTIWYVWAIGVFIQSYLIDFFFIKRNNYHRVVPVFLPAWRKKIHLVGRFVSLLVFYLWPFFVFDFTKALIWATVPYGIFSMYFLTVSQVGHVVDESIAPPQHRDFITVLHTHNFGTDSLLWFYFSGGLNLQVEHHIFPGVNHCHLRYLAPKVKAIAKKHGVTYHESTNFFSALWKHYKVILACAIPYGK